MQLKNWSQPADALKFIGAKEKRERNIQLYTDGSKSEHGVGSGVAIFAGIEHAAQLKFKLDKKCSNKQAERLAVVKALEAIVTLDITENGPRTAGIFTDSRMTIVCLKNTNNHNILIE